jgi:hypothetical protein
LGRERGRVKEGKERGGQEQAIDRVDQIRAWHVMYRNFLGKPIHLNNCYELIIIIRFFLKASGRQSSCLMFSVLNKC